MIDVIVLFEGYASTSDNGKVMKANCTCTLIKGPEYNIIIDTMTPWDKDKLLLKLQKEHHLTPEDINYVISTHGHSDHVGNNNLFLKAIHIVGQSVSKGDEYYLDAFQDGKYDLNEHVQVFHTPGHTLDHVSVRVKTTKGLFVVAGDLFERQEDLFDEQIWKDAGSENAEMQAQSRKLVLTEADFIIPGHGPMFSNDIVRSK